MADLPILFSKPMVRALLAGSKTQTRRMVKRQPNVPKNGVWYRPFPDRPHQYEYLLGNQIYGYLAVKWAPGDRLWVRETWRTESSAYDKLKPRELAPETPVLYDADAVWSANKSAGKTRVAIHMPRWASRLTLTVTEVRVQQLKEISEEDAAAEGIGAPYLGDGDSPFEESAVTVSRVMQFRNLWNQLHGPDAWQVNPLVAVPHFEVERKNIDA